MRAGRSTGSFGDPPRELFSTRDLRAILDNARSLARQAVESYPVEDLLSQSEDDIVAYLASPRYSDAPVLDREHIAIAEHGEAQIDVSRRFDYAVSNRRAPAYIPGERVEVAIPFRGDKNLFDAQPASYSSMPPRAIVLNHELRLVYEDVSLDAHALRQRIDRDVSDIANHVDWLHVMTDEYDQELPGIIRSAVRTRKQRLLSARNTVAAIGLPVRRSDEPDGFSIPLHSTQVSVPRPPAAHAAFQPEPILADADFEDALSVLGSMRNTFERLGRSRSSLNEEAVRDILLVGLNARFKGAAGGELFNGAGKTDILIRVEDRNVFIGECKIWRGAKSCTEAIDQLLSYVVWRDCKAALLLFVRDKAATETIAKATATIEQHARCKRRLSDRDPTEFVFSADGDPNREIRLALVPFVVPRGPRPNSDS